MKIIIPLMFWQDHCGRDLPGGTLVRTMGKRVEIEISSNDLAELKSDADHYANGGTDWEDGKALFRSAKRTLEILEKVK